MVKVLSLFRRKGAPDGDVRAAPAAPPSPRPVPTSPQQPAGAAKPRSTNDGDGAVAEETAPAAAPAAELVVARRQSQINLNKFLASAPSGLAALLKHPSRGDLEPLRSQGSGSLQVPSAGQPSTQAQQQQQQQQHAQAQPGGAGGDSLPMKITRERRKSMVASELASTLQNIDVTQAAMIMMPARLRQELGGGQSFVSQPLSSLQSIPVPTRSSAPLPNAALSADSYSLAAVLGSTAAAAAAAGSPSRLERKPSLIREAVKVQAQQQPQQTRGSVATESPVRGQAMGHSSGDLPGAPGVEQRPGGLNLANRRGSVVTALLQPQLGAAQLGGPSRASMAVGGMGGVGSPSSPTHGPSRRSEVGETGNPLRTRHSVPAGFEAPGMPAGPALASNGGHPLSPSVNGNGAAYMLPGTASNKDLRRGGGGLGVRGSELMLMSAAAADDDGQYDAVRLPVIGGNGTPTRRVVIDSKEPRDTSGPAAHGGGRGGLTAADVAALSEAISSYQTEAARLRAMAVRKVDSRIKRAVMDRRLTSDEDAMPSSTSLLDGNIAGSLLAPLLRGQQPAAAGNSRSNPQQPASRGGPRGAAQAGAAGSGGSAGAGGGPGDALARARTRLQETEAEAAEELSQMRRNSTLAPRLIAAELLSDPTVPRRR